MLEYCLKNIQNGGSLLITGLLAYWVRKILFSNMEVTYNVSWHTNLL